MASEAVKFKRGLSTDLPADLAPGNILLETDTGTMYVDTDTDKVQVKDPTKLPLEGGTVTGSVVQSAVVEDASVEFRNSVVVKAGTDVTSLDVPQGTLIFVAEE